MTPDDPRVRRNHRDEWARLDARRTPPAEWAAFLAGAKDGEFDLD